MGWSFLGFGDSATVLLFEKRWFVTIAPTDRPFFVEKNLSQISHFRYTLFLGEGRFFLRIEPPSRQRAIEERDYFGLWGTGIFRNITGL